MNNKNFILSIAMGIALVNGVFANNPNRDIEIFDINSVEYIEEEAEVNLGFDTADYLPEGFNPYKMYVDLTVVQYIEEEIAIADVSEHLPEGFDAYAYPTNVDNINYIDENDELQLNFDTKKHLPKGFNAYIK